MDKRTINRTLRQNSTDLEGVTRHVRPAATWADLGMPAKVGSALREICDRVKHSTAVSGRNRKRDTGLVVLFFGMGGAGKFKAAEVIANELHADLCRIDLSALASKYIGETEKNLARLFDTADAANTILYFDEADALFGKRSEVKDAHDRYANLETGYLLGRMERYAGMTIVAANSRVNIDDAFVRHMHRVVEFPPENA